MKKFTGNFLLGEHGLGNVLRKVGLSMVAILMTVVVFAQAQDTYHVFAENVSDCYRADNNYEVQISFRDFVKIDTFELVLEYDKDVFSFVGFDGVHSVLQGGTYPLTVVENTAGKLTFNWGEDNPVTFGTIEPNNDTIPVVTLHFALDGFPYTYGPVGANQYVFASDLEWTKAIYWNDEENDVTDILTAAKTDGSLTATQDIEVSDITVTTADAFCDGTMATATVTAPAGDYLYSFNGNTFTAEASTDVLAVFEDATQQTVELSDAAEECVSFIYQFEVEAPEPLAYAAPSPVYTQCPGGYGDIEINVTGGTAPFTYYVIPDADYAALNLTQGNWADKLLPFARTNRVIQVPAGTVAEPEVYWVAVNDANGCNAIELNTDGGSFIPVQVIDDKEAFAMEVAEHTDLQCNDQPEGILDFALSGGTPWQIDDAGVVGYNESGDEGYKIWVNDAYKGIVESLKLTDLAAGDVDILVQDYNGCDWDTTIVITQPAKIMFDLTHTDTGCNDDLGTITLDWANITGGTFADLTGATYEGTEAYWALDTLPSYANIFNATPVWKGDLDVMAEGLPSGVYYVMVFDENGCYNNYMNSEEANDDAVKILDYELEVTWNDIACNDGTTTVTIGLVTGDGNHKLGYKLVPTDENGVVAPGDGAPFTASNVFENVTAGYYKAAVNDTTVGCIYREYIYIANPSPIHLDVIGGGQFLPPTCPGNSDGNVTIVAHGGTPWESVVGGKTYKTYKYKIDEGEWIESTEYNTFAVDTAMHVVTVEDSKGCSEEIYIDLPNYENVIDFVDVIHNECALGEINLFNRFPEQCSPQGPVKLGDDEVANGPFYFWNPAQWSCDTVQFDFGYMNYFEWYGIPLEHFGGTLTFDINIWTSDSGWVTRTLQGVQQIREPILYWTAVDPAGNAETIYDGGQMIYHNTTFAAGDYWIVARDEWGCYSNIEQVTIVDPAPLAVTVTPEDAGCDGSFDGLLKIEAENGRFPIPNMIKPFARYQYVLTQQPQIFTHNNWVEDVTWSVFANSGDFANDSVGFVNISEGTYWLAVRDWCGIENTDLIWFSGPIEIKAADPIEIDWDIAKITDVTCNIWTWTGTSETPDSADDGMVTGLYEAVSGGYGDYTVTIKPVSGGTAQTVEAGDDVINLAAGEYLIVVVDGSEYGCELRETITITEPQGFRVTNVIVNASCNDAHDGILRYKIEGGTPPYMEATNDDFIWASQEEIPAYAWVNPHDSEGAWLNDVDGVVADSAYVFDRRVRAGVYDIWVKDAHDCYYHIHVPVEVKEPGKLQITDVKSYAVSCNDQSELNLDDIDNLLIADGSISFDPKGGWDMDDDFIYYAELYKNTSAGAVLIDTKMEDELVNDWMFDGLTEGDYTIKLYEYSDVIAAWAYTGGLTDNYWEDPVNSYVDYFLNTDWLEFAPYQNPFLDIVDTEDACFATYDVTVDEPDAITYTPEWIDVMCHNTHTGQIVLTDIMGGTPGTTSSFKGYWVGLEGPQDYDASLQTKPGASYTDNSIVWFETKGNSFTFDNLIWGHYTIHIMDANGCWIYKESGEVENQDLLEITQLEVMENVTCHGDTTGILKMVVTGGVPFTDGDGYEFAVGAADHEFPTDYDAQTYFESLTFSGMDDTLYVPAGTWIAYARDAMGCITGFSTDMNGAPVTQHRADVLEPDPVEAGDFGQIAASCNGVEDGQITIEEIWGGNNGAWTVTVTGDAFDESPVYKQFVVEPKNGETFDVKLEGLYATIDEEELAYFEANNMSIPDSLKYTITVEDAEGCMSAEYKQWVTHPALFEIEIVQKQDAIICPEDLSGLFEINVVAGGNPFGYDVNNEPQYMYKWEAYNDDSYQTDDSVEPIDELSDDEYGFIKTFLGYGGYWYRVWAIDEKGCDAMYDTFITAPKPVMFDITEITCYGETLASARITITDREPGRAFNVWYLEESNSSAVWTKYNGLFSADMDEIDILETFKFDNEQGIGDDVHYLIYLEDTLGCKSNTVEQTFDYVQHVLNVEAEVTEQGECTSEVTITVTGGTPPYVVEVDGAVVADMTQKLGEGEHTITVTDAHLRCMDETTVDVVAMPVAKDDAVTTYFGEKVSYSYSDGDVVVVADSMLAEGVTVFPYDYMGCPRTLTVTVTGMPRVLTVKAVQGEVDASPWADAIVEVSATVTAVVENTGFFMQDANGPWNGIWVAYADVTTDGIQVGNGATVVGTVAEVETVTTLQATSVTLGAAPAAITEDVVSAPSDVETEAYESVLSQVQKARGTAADATTGEWTIYYETTDDVVVDNWMYTYAPVEGNYFNVIGVVDRRMDVSKLQPRMASDIVDWSATTATIDIDNIEFKVYPNPFNDIIKIDNADKLTRVVVSNVAGQRVIDVEYPSNEIRTENLVSGVYVVSLFTENGIAKTERIVKR